MTQKFKVVHYCLNPNPKTDTLQKPFFTITCKNKNIGFIYNVDFINEQSHKATHYLVGCVKRNV